jgi:hypothetical protein
VSKYIVSSVGAQSRLSVFLYTDFQYTDFQRLIRKGLSGKMNRDLDWAMSHRQMKAFMTQTTRHPFGTGLDARGARFVPLTPVSLLIRAAEAVRDK